MRNRIISLVVLAVFTMGIAATAQVTRQKTETQGEVHRQAFAQKLGLTPEQKQKIGEITKAYFAEIKPILQSNLTPEEKRAQVEPIRTRAIGSIMALLTPEQQAKAREMELEDRMLRPIHNRKAAGIMWALSQLNLTEQQKASVKDIFTASREQAKAIKENASLTPEQKKTQFMELKQATHNQVMGLLTPEQQQKLNEIIEEHKQQRPQGAENHGKRAAGQKTRAK